MYIPSEDTSNAVIATIGSLPGYLVAFVLSQSDLALIALTVNVVLFFIGKGIDVAVRLHFEKQKK